MAGSVPAELRASGVPVRPAGPADAIAGVLPSFVAEPASTEQAAAVLRAAAGLGLTVVFRGTGTRLDWGSPPRHCELVISTRSMNSVLEHAAGDLIVRAQAGVTLAELGAALAPAGQRLALDPPPAPRSAAHPPSTATPLETRCGHNDTRLATVSPDAAAGAGTGTVGGALATGVAGPLRLRYGTPRDLVIGITVVRADGVVARSGGKVVKNVAGYDLGKLFAGSHGTLGLIAEATFRLHPLPGAARYVTVRCVGAAGAYAALRGALDSPLEPIAAEIHRPGRGGPLSVAFLLEGHAEAVAARAERLAGLISAASGGGPGATGSPVSDRPPSWWGRPPAAADGTLLRIGFWPGRLPGVLDAIDEAAAATGLDPVSSGSAAAGVLHAGLPAASDPTAVAAFVEKLRGSAALSGGTDTGPASRGSVVVLTAPPSVRERVDLWGPVPSLPLMRAVKDQFDPEHLLAPGRFAGGI
jgi:glycolate oxidase FAD binding subunit